MGDARLCFKISVAQLQAFYLKRIAWFSALNFFGREILNCIPVNIIYQVLPLKYFERIGVLRFSKWDFVYSKERLYSICSIILPALLHGFRGKSLCMECQVCTNFLNFFSTFSLSIFQQI